MPELPEIETVKLQLAKVLVGRRIMGVEVLKAKTAMGDVRRAEGKKVTGLGRKAKVLIVDLEDGLAMAFHFKLTGQLILDQDDDGKTWEDRVVGGHPTEDFENSMPSKHTRVIFKLDRGTLYFNDQRMFGWVRIGTREEIEQEKFMQNLGPEPFDIDEKEFTRRVAKSKKPINRIRLRWNLGWLWRILVGKKLGDLKLPGEGRWRSEVMELEVYPEGLRWAIEVVEDLGKPIFISENGYEDSDDERRIKFVAAHLRVLAQCLTEGRDVRGYFYWTLLDNFEWALGYGPRFGLLTRERKPKGSAWVLKRAAGARIVAQNVRYSL